MTRSTTTVPADRSPADDGAAMLVVLVCMLLASMLSIGLLGMITSELVPTAHQRKSARTLAAAHAGIEAALSAVRAATSTASGLGTGGDPRKLPCYSAASPLTGQLDDTPNQPPVGFTVRVDYFTVNPAGQAEAWRAANAITCRRGQGTTTTPVYALVRSRGAATDTRLPGTWGDRATEAVYTLRRTDQARLGGPIRTHGAATSVRLCWQAVIYPPIPGTGIQLAPCVAGDEAQLFAYRRDYSIALAATQSPDPAALDGLCVQQQTSTTPWTLTLQPCASGSWQQMWSYDDKHRFLGVGADKSSLSNICISTGGSWVSGAPFFPQANCNWPNQIWAPDPAVGAGAAGEATGQLVNYGEYGRCLDITDFNVNWPWHISFPCKQDPTRPVGWNQRFVHDSATTRQIQTNTGNGLYCLTAPTGSQQVVLTTPCAPDQDRQRWTRYGDTGVRSSSYTFVDSTGRCLSLGPSPATDPDLGQWSAIVVARCDGSNIQKWNAPPLPVGSVLGGERETTGDG